MTRDRIYLIRFTGGTGTAHYCDWYGTRELAERCAEAYLERERADGCDPGGYEIEEYEIVAGRQTSLFEEVRNG